MQEEMREDRRQQDSICIFADGENKGCAPSSRRAQQSTGLLHLDGFESCCPNTYTKKKNHTKWCGFLFGGDNRTRTCDLMRVKHAL